MNIVTTRRVSQVFFFLLFIWFCTVATVGERFWQLRGWPVNWLLQLDPLVGLATALSTHSLYAGLVWGVVTLMGTVLVGRFFCGWICPLGTLQHLIGHAAGRALPKSERIARNQPHPAQSIKYWVLLFLLAASAADLIRFLTSAPWRSAHAVWLFLFAAVVLGVLLATFRVITSSLYALGFAAAVVTAGAAAQAFLPNAHWLAASLQIGLFDPLALIHRSFNLALLPLADNPAALLFGSVRYYRGATLIGALFLIVIMLSIRIPRFYCRYICPTGALMGLLGRWAPWRIRRTDTTDTLCKPCRDCEADCEGACAPSQVIKNHECVLCFNCLDQCRRQRLQYARDACAASKLVSPDLGRRGVLLAVAAGLAAPALSRLEGLAVHTGDPRLVRPPGALKEVDFLSRCIKCGQCMRVCPTNVIQPAAWQAGWEGLWTPVLDFRLGTSGCQHTCVACGQTCPTAAIRPLRPDERVGRGAFTTQGPVRIGMAFIDHGRCLPWAMGTPCIVCQENCPVSPKAIHTRAVSQPVRHGAFHLQTAGEHSATLDMDSDAPEKWGSGDYFCDITGQPARLITSVQRQTLGLAPLPAWTRLPAPNTPVQIVIRLQQPYVDTRHCIGCGVCEHECPVRGLRAIRVTAENESRSRLNRLTV